ncbi:MAG: DUF4177 domain-containing protein [Rhodobacteraceae bacterium]|nr:DUF4177 domain-containing protein [Paracoccaceae bacterium]
MTRYEYRVVPAPTKGKKEKGAKSPEQRFAAAIEMSLNDEAGTGWEFLRAETLPSTERQGLTGSKTVYQTLLVFRRQANAADEEAPAKETLRLLEDRSPDTAPEPGLTEAADKAAPAPARAES